MDYEAPRIIELGTVADFTRGDKFALDWDGMSLSQAIGQLLNGVPIGDVIGTS